MRIESSSSSLNGCICCNGATFRAIIHVEWKCPCGRYIVDRTVNVVHQGDRCECRNRSSQPLVYGMVYRCGGGGEGMNAMVVEEEDCCFIAIAPTTTGIVKDTTTSTTLDTNAYESLL